MDEQEFKDRLKVQAQNLLAKIDTGNMNDIKLAMEELDSSREPNLYQLLGKLTRQLHDTMKHVTSQVPDHDAYDVKSRLNYVIQLTEDAANKTMDGIESSLPLSEQLARESKSLLEEWTRLGRREMELEEFRQLYQDMMSFLASVAETVSIIHGNLQKVLVAQNYQDLSGQAIRKVMTFVTDLEARLVELVAVAADAGYGENIEDAKPEQKPESTLVKNQDEVDDLLSSLGF